MLPSVPVWRAGDRVVFDRKFYDGMRRHVAEWPGAICCIMRVSDTSPPAFGLVEKRPDEVPFDLRLIGANERIALRHLEGASVVLCSGDDFDQLHISDICCAHGIKCVYSIEYTPETRQQILRLEDHNPLVKMRRALFLRAGERRRRRAFARADAVQANGAAAFDEYGQHDNCMVYYDTRMREGDLIDEAALERRLRRLSAGRPLRLGFSGRLVKMKGADHLVKLAVLLRARGVDFTMTIFGAGALEDEMRREIRALSLEGQVDMRGAVDFHEELVPYIRENIDLYVVLHRQSDPSCTYLETLGCGVPIVGYDNKAFAGLVAKGQVGWQVEMDDLIGVTAVIERLSQAPEEIRARSRSALRFARRHDFETTFQTRNRQLVALAYGARAPARLEAPSWMATADLQLAPGAAW